MRDLPMFRNLGLRPFQSSLRDEEVISCSFWRLHSGYFGLLSLPSSEVDLAISVNASFCK